MENFPNSDSRLRFWGILGCKWVLFRQHHCSTLSFWKSRRIKKTFSTGFKKFWRFFWSYCKIVNYNNYRGSHIGLSWFSCRFYILVELESGDVGFCGGRKTGGPREKSLEQGRSQYKLNPHMAPGRNSTPEKHRYCKLQVILIKTRYISRGTAPLRILCGDDSSNATYCYARTRRYMHQICSCHT